MRLPFPFSERSDVSEFLLQKSIRKNLIHPNPTPPRWGNQGQRLIHQRTLDPNAKEATSEGPTRSPEASRTTPRTTGGIAGPTTRAPTSPTKVSPSLPVIPTGRGRQPLQGTKVPAHPKPPGKPLQPTRAGRTLLVPPKSFRRGQKGVCPTTRRWRTYQPSG